LSTLDTLSDEELIRAFSRGREDAFEEIVRRHARGIKAHALRMLRNPQEAEQVYVETFTRLAVAGRRWKPTGTLKSFVYTVAHNLCLDLIRRCRTEQEAHPELVGMEQMRSLQPSPEAVAMTGELARQLERGIAGLSEEHRTVLLLRTLHGLSGKETAEVVGLDEGQFRSMLSYARKKLREQLAETMTGSSGEVRGR